MKFIKIFSLSLLFFLVQEKNTVAQNISGIINIYKSVNNIAGNVITVSSSVGLNIGDKVLIIQMKGASVDVTNTAAFGNITAYNNCGNYEFGIITAINGNNVTLQFPLCHQYTIADKVQLVNVPQYTNPVVTATLTCAAWNGTSGGILIFEASGTLTLNADIDVSGNGFRGGQTCLAGFGCSNQNFFLNFTPFCNSGQKGEGIAEWVAGQDGGMGKLANGGGGGNPGNSGGGGGGNFGSGGLGGFEYSGCGATGVQGRGGALLNFVPGKLFMGGGGGGGFSDNSQSVTAGTNGGGMIYIKANAIAGNNFYIRSNSPNQTLVANDESAGGGGAGGTIVLNVTNYTSNTNVEANGGKGGDTFNFIFTNNCHGPGAGGSGGTLWLNQAVAPANLAFVANGGLSGLVMHPTSPCFNTPFGATAGAAGGILFNFIPPSILTPVNLGNDTAICPSQSVLLNAGAGFASYLWQNGSQLQTITASVADTFYVVVTDAAGCTATDSVIISLLPPLNVNLGNDTTLCGGQTLLLNAGAGYTNYLWQNASSMQTYLAPDSGLYHVTVTNNLNCTGTDSIHISYFNSVPPNIGNDTSICPGQTVLFNAGNNFHNFVWQNNSTQQTFSSGTVGTYFVHALTVNNCPVADTAKILSLNPVPPANVIVDTFLCPGETILLNAPAGFTYLWSDGSTAQTFSVSASAQYNLLLINNFGCSAVSDFFVGENCPPGLFFPTAFTPNADGVNDKFLPKYYKIGDYHLYVFNRWGQLVFDTDKIYDGWDGTYQGIKSEMGSYVWFVRYTTNEINDTQNKQMKGNVSLLR